MSLLLLLASSAAAQVTEARFSSTASALTLQQGQSGTQTITITNNGPTIATNTVVTYTPPTGVTVSSVTASPGGACTLSGSTYTCPSVATLAVNGTITLTVPMTASGTATIGTYNGAIRVNSTEYNPGSGIGEQNFKIWGTRAASSTGGFWPGYTGPTNSAFDEDGESILGAWPAAQTSPTGAFTVTNPSGTGNATYGTSSTTYAPTTHTIETSPVSISLPSNTGDTDNRRAWELSVGVTVDNITNLFVCITQPDDGMYILVDGSVAYTQNAWAGTAAYGNTTAITLSPGYHAVTYRIVNRNTRSTSGNQEGSAGGFGGIGIGTSQTDCASSITTTQLPALLLVPLSAPVTITQATGSLSGTVFGDINANATQDGSETAFTTQSVTVTATNTATNATTTTTTSTGSYTFTNLPVGNYTVTASSVGYVVTTSVPTVAVALNTSTTVPAIGLATQLFSAACKTVLAGGSNAIRSINPATGATISTVYTPNYETRAFATDPVTERLYFIEYWQNDAYMGYYNLSGSGSNNQIQINGGSTFPNTAYITRFGFNASGVGYAADNQNQLYRIVTSGTSVTVTSLGTISGLPTSTNGGDFAFDAAGYAWLVMNGDIYRINVTATTPTATLVLSTGNPDVNGAAFDENGNLLVSSSTQLYSINMGTLSQTTVGSFTFTGSQDLASCVTPTLIPAL